MKITEQRLSEIHQKVFYWTSNLAAFKPTVFMSPDLIEEFKKYFNVSIETKGTPFEGKQTFMNCPLKELQGMKNTVIVGF